jgi:alcohol dehydrogenase class IV
LAIAVVQSLQELVKDVGLPITLAEYPIHREDIKRLAENGFKQTRLLKRSPKPLNLESIEQIYRNAYEGVLVNR